MKRFFRLSALVIALVLLALTLCSCQYVDDARSHQAFYTDDTKREISYGDHVYKILNPGNRSFVFTGTYVDDYFYSVTEKDVPALLARFEGDFIDFNEERTIMRMWDSWYIRDDVYNRVKDALQNSELDHYWFSYIEYPEEDDLSSDMRQENVLLDDETTEAVNRTLALPEDERISYTELSDSDYGSKIIYLSNCDKDMFITDSSTVYLLNDRGEYYIWNGNEYDENSIFPVSEDDRAIIKRVFDDYPDAADEYNVRWYFESDYYDYDYNDYGYYNSNMKPQTVQN